MNKRPHKVLNIEMNPSNQVRYTALGVTRVTLDGPNLTAGQKALLDGKAKDTCGA